MQLQDIVIKKKFEKILKKEKKNFQIVFSRTSVPRTYFFIIAGESLTFKTILTVDKNSKQLFVYLFS